MAVVDDLRQTADSRGDDWQAEGEGLDHHHGKAFVPERRDQKNGGAFHLLDNLRARQAAEIDEARARTGASALNLGKQGAVASHMHGERKMAATVGGDDSLQPFFGAQPTDEESEAALSLSAAVIRDEIRLDADLLYGNSIASKFLRGELRECDIAIDTVLPRPHGAVY